MSTEKYSIAKTGYSMNCKKNIRGYVDFKTIILQFSFILLTWNYTLFILRYFKNCY